MLLQYSIFAWDLQNVSKFIPHLSDITKPVRDTHKNIQPKCNHSQQEALEVLKKVASSIQILQYRNLEKKTLQCDVSQCELDAVLMQNRQPMGYTSRALTFTESRYVQIENELLAIVFACDPMYIDKRKYTLRQTINLWSQ